MAVDLYTAEVRELLHSYKWPKGLIVHVVEYQNHISLRLYRDNFITFDGVDMEYVAKVINEALSKINKLGCPCLLEVLPECPKT